GVSLLTCAREGYQDWANMNQRTNLLKASSIAGGLILLAASACSDGPATTAGAGGGGSGGTGGFADGGSAGGGGRAGSGGSSGASGSSGAAGSPDAGARVTKWIAGGIDYNCAISSSGVLKCWGYNFAGELALGDTNARGDGPGEMGAALAAVA